jgi:hypothetical protein
VLCLLTCPPIAHCMDCMTRYCSLLVYFFCFRTETAHMEVQVKSFYAWRSWARKVCSNRVHIAAMRAQSSQKRLQHAWDRWRYCAQRQGKHSAMAGNSQRGFASPTTHNGIDRHSIRRNTRVVCIENQLEPLQMINMSGVCQHSFVICLSPECRRRYGAQWCSCLSLE